MQINNESAETFQIQQDELASTVQSTKNQVHNYSLIDSLWSDKWLKSAGTVYSTFQGDFLRMSGVDGR